MTLSQAWKLLRARSHMAIVKDYHQWKWDKDNDPEKKKAREDKKLLDWAIETGENWSMYLKMKGYQGKKAW